MFFKATFNLMYSRVENSEGLTISKLAGGVKQGQQKRNETGKAKDLLSTLYIFVKLLHLVPRNEHLLGVGALYIYIIYYSCIL